MDSKSNENVKEESTEFLLRCDLNKKITPIETRKKVIFEDNKDILTKSENQLNSLSHEISRQDFEVIFSSYKSRIEELEATVKNLNTLNTQAYLQVAAAEHKQYETERNLKAFEFKLEDLERKNFNLDLKNYELENLLSKLSSKRSEPPNPDSVQELLKLSECPICFAELMKIDARLLLITPCGHLFCSSCLTTHFKTTSLGVKCPKCQKIILIKDCHHLYF